MMCVWVRFVPLKRQTSESTRKKISVCVYFSHKNENHFKYLFYSYEQRECRRTNKRARVSASEREWVSEWRLMERVRNNWCKWSRNNTHTNANTQQKVKCENKKNDGTKKELDTLCVGVYLSMLGGWDVIIRRKMSKPKWKKKRRMRANSKSCLVSQPCTSHNEEQDRAFAWVEQYNSKCIHSTYIELLPGEFSYSRSYLFFPFVPFTFQ